MNAGGLRADLPEGLIDRSHVVDAFPFLNANVTLMMPIMDGPSMIVAVLRMKPSARIIASSGLNANGRVTKAVDAGIKHFLPNPYTAETLLRTLRRVLDGDAVSDR